MKYLVIWENTATCSACVPDLAGGVTTGPTLEDIERLIQEAVDPLDGLHEDRLTAPAPSTTADDMTAA
jgi:predicted RNase H-like HicB family nuclease